MIRCVFQTRNAPELVFGRSSAPDPACGLQTSSRTGRAMLGLPPYFSFLIISSPLTLTASRHILFYKSSTGYSFQPSCSPFPFPWWPWARLLSSTVLLAATRGSWEQFR